MGNKFEQPSRESRENNEFREVSADILSELVVSERFMESTQLAHDMSVKLNEEAGFAVGQNLKSGKVIMGKTIHADQTSVFLDSRDSSIYDIGGSSFSEKFVGLVESGGAIELFDFHTHPNGTIEPSNADLSSLIARRESSVGEKGIDYYPLSAILAFPISSSHTEAHLLVLQEKRSEHIRESEVGSAVSDYIENTLAITSDKSYEKILDVINSSHAIQAELFKLERSGGKGKFSHTISKDEIRDKFLKFAFTPKRVPTDYEQIEGVHVSK